MNDKNKALHAGLMKILNEATFSLRAREVTSFGAVYNWAKDLQNSFIEKPEPKPKKKITKKVAKK